MALIAHILLSFLLLFSMLCDAEGPASVRKNNSFEEADLVSFLNSKPSQHDAVFAEAVQLLESMRSSPSCNRLAASRLVTSCQSIGEKASNIDTEIYLLLEHTRSLYAARLAICELNGAGTSIPPACLPVTIPPPQKKGIFGFSAKSKVPANDVDSIPNQLLESCLKSLESRPQWWTSYSNKNTQSQFKSVFEKVFYNIETGAVSIVNTVASMLGRVQDQATALDKNIQNVSAEVTKLQYTFRDLLDEVLSRNEQITLAHQQNAMSHNELAVLLRSKLESLLQEDMARLFHNVEAFDASLEWLSGRFGLLSEQELSISDRLRTFETSLKEFQLKAEDLHKAQLQQSENLEIQSRLQEKLQTSIRISQALIDKAATTTANLQVMIEETTALYKDSPTLGILFSTYSSWTIFGLLLSLIASHNIKFALVMLVIGVTHLMMKRIL